MATVKKPWNLSADELRALADSPKNSGLYGRTMVFVIIVLLNIVPTFFKNPILFTKEYFTIVIRNFLSVR